MKRILLSTSAIIALSSAALGQQLPAGTSRPAIAPTDLVYPGCPVPPTTFGHIWYIDPVHGKTQAAGGLGTQAAPWDSLVALTGAKINGQLQVVPGYSSFLLSTVWNSGGPIHPGDEVVLMSGNYGDIGFGGLSVPGALVVNPQPVTFVAGPGQTPVLSTLALAGASGFVFDTMTVQSHANVGSGSLFLIQVSDANIAGSPSTNVVFKNMTVQSDTPANVNGWTVAQMGANERNGFNFGGTNGGANMTCVSMTGSHISGVRGSGFLEANKTLFQNNEMDHFSNDGLDYAASGVAIINNYLHDSQSIEDGIHTDGIQGQEPSGPNPAATPGVQPEHDIYIARNRIIQQVDPNLKFSQYLQAIDAFDGDWTNVIVENNQIATSSCHGIDEESIHNAAILNNSVIDTGIFADEPGCDAAIIVTTSHEGSVSSNVLIENNVAPGFNILVDPSTGQTITHNVAYSNREPSFRDLVTFTPTVTTAQEGLTPGVVAPAVLGVANTNDGLGAVNEFTSVVAPYNFTFKAGAPALTTLFTPPPLLPPAWRSPTLPNSWVLANKSVTLQGTSTGGSTVSVYDGSTLLGTLVVPGSFVWSFTTPVLASGVHVFTATETDTGTAPSAPSGALSVTIP